MKAALRQKYVVGEAQVDLGYQIHSHLNARQKFPLPVQRPVTQIFIDMPDTFARALGGDAEQNWAVVAQADRWQPPAHDQLVALSDGRLQSLDDERANRSVQVES